MITLVSSPKQHLRENMQHSLLVENTNKTYFKYWRTILSSGCFPAIAHVFSAFFFDQISGMAVMGITEALANPAVLHGHQVNQAAAEAEKSFNGRRLHDAVSAQPPNASVWVNVKPNMGVGFIGILYRKKMQSSSVVARLQLSHWNKGLPLIGLVDLVHLGSLKHVQRLMKAIVFELIYL